MSGGSMDYLYYRVEECASMLKDKELVDLAKDFAKLLHDCEWADSGDTSDGSYNKSVIDFKNKWFCDSAGREDRLKGYIDESIKSVSTELHNLIGGANFCKDCKNWKRSGTDSEYGQCRDDNWLTHGYEFGCSDYEKSCNS